MPQVEQAEDGRGGSWIDFLAGWRTLRARWRVGRLAGLWAGKGFIFSRVGKDGG
jgi:hypothetical protein